MLYVVAGLLKPGAEEQIIAVHDDFNEHLSQSEIIVAGALRNDAGRRVGYVAVIDVPDSAAARAFLNESPLWYSHLYERTEVLELDVEVCRLS